jgi:deoxyribodipyrimidine photo-lyase
VTALMWFTRDLRVNDKPALRAALDRHERVVSLFCFDDRLLGGRHASGPRTQFLIECLSELASALRHRGSGLVVRRGRPERELATLARELDASEVFVSDDVSPFARRRVKAVGAALAETAAELRPTEGLFVADSLRAIETTTRDPRTVFTRFHRTWSQQPRRELARLRVPAGTRVEAPAW